MKKIVSLILGMISVLAYSQTIAGPEFVIKSHETLEIMRVVRNEKETMFHMIIRNRLDEGGNFCVDKNTVLIAGNKTYRIEEIIGIPECPEVHNFEFIGDNLHFYLHFPPIPNEIKVVDLIEQCSENCFSFKSVILDLELQKEMLMAFDYFESGLVQKALASYKELLTKYENAYPGLEALFFFYIITIHSENGNSVEAEKWKKKFTSRDIPGSEWVLEKLEEEI